MGLVVLEEEFFTKIKIRIIRWYRVKGHTSFYAFSLRIRR